MRPCRFRCIFHLRDWRPVGNKWHVFCNRCGRLICVAIDTDTGDMH